MRGQGREWSRAYERGSEGGTESRVCVQDLRPLGPSLGAPTATPVVVGSLVFCREVEGQSERS